MRLVPGAVADTTGRVSRQPGCPLLVRALAAPCALAIACSAGPAASPPGPPAEPPSTEEPASAEPAFALAPLPPPSPGALPEIRFAALRSGKLPDGVYRVTGYYLGPTTCPKGPPNAGMCGSRWILGARGRTPDGVARSGELGVYATYDVTGVALVREPGELSVAELSPGKKYVLIVAVREISATRFLTLRGGRPMP